MIIDEDIFSNDMNICSFL